MLHPFTKDLLHWHKYINDRVLPWKGEKDPYRIWLSEIILQQTRAEQGLPYYERFIKQYPTLEKLAAAPEDEVFKLWQGLGYYSRCRNMIKAARHMMEKHKGQMPENYQAILDLPGVGPYTASAIASFAFGLPYPVIDGNVNRVLARYFGMKIPVDSTEGKKKIEAYAHHLIDREHAAAYNQAIMDLGATVCKPQSAACGSCPVNTGCYAWHHQETDTLPVKAKSVTIYTRHFVYLVLKQRGGLYFEQRKDKDIWQGLYQPYLLEWDHEPSEDEVQRLVVSRFDSGKATFIGIHKQKLTHRIIQSYWYELEIGDASPAIPGGCFYDREGLKALALPKTIFSFMSKNNYF